MASLGASYARMNLAGTALRFLFHVTLARPGFGDRMARIASPERLPVVLSVEEVVRLLAHAPGLKYRAALSIAYGCGLRVSEIIHLKVTDIDSARMLIRVERPRAHPHRRDARVSLPVLRRPPDRRRALPPRLAPANTPDRRRQVRHIMIAAPNTTAISDRGFRRPSLLDRHELARAVAPDPAPPTPPDASGDPYLDAASRCRSPVGIPASPPRQTSGRHRAANRPAQSP
jgi:integrase